jgi:ATP-dependent DNA helicase RecG
VSGSRLARAVLEEDQGGVRIIFLKDIYSEGYLTQLGINDRQMLAVFFIKQNGYITNSKYQQEYKVSARTALRDLDDLVTREILVKAGDKKGARYLLKR